MTPERWQRVEALLDEALDRSAGEREAWVRQRSGDDSTLAEEVLALLAEIDGAGVLDQPLVELTEAAVPAVDGLGVGQRIGAWRLIEPLGSGGMGRVFVARREGGDFEQRAAVKLLRWEMATPGAVERFRTERQILAELDHPGIARLIDGGVDDEGVPFLAMELIDGEPIDAYCRSHDLSLTERLRLVVEICDAVQAAHGRLIIHRDLKPSNILVTAEGQVRLLDFGIGKVLGESAGDVATQTVGGLAPATPAYAAPEQLEGQTMSVATDVYGLGVVLYELLTGRSPFVSEGSSPVDVLRNVLDTEAAPPSRSSGENGPIRAHQLRGDLDNIVLKALRKEPERRYASVAALAADLERYLDGRPVTASPATLSYRVGKFVGRNRLAAALSALLLAVAIGAAVGIAKQSREARLEAARAGATADFLERTLIDANLQNDTAGDDSLSALLERAEPRVDVELADYPEVRVRVRGLLARAFHGLGRAEEAQRLHRQTLDEATEHSGADSPAAGWALVGLVNSGAMADVEARLDALQRALAIMEAHHGRRSEQAVEVHNLIGHVHVSANQLDDAEVSYRTALEMARETLGSRDRWVATALANLGSLFKRLRRWDEAVDALERALAIYADDPGEDTHIAITIRNNLALALAEAGRFAEAEAEYARTIELRKAKLGEEHPTLALTRTNLGRLLMDQARFDDARQPIQRAAEVLVAASPERDFTRIAAEINLATLSLEHGELDKAHRLYTTAHRRFIEQLGEAHPATLRAGWLLGEAERRRQRYGAARTLLDRLPAGELPDNEVRFADWHLSMGRMAADTGDPAGAASHFEKALAIYEQQLAPGHWRQVEARAELATLAAPDERRRTLPPLVDRLRKVLPADNWRLGRLEAALE